MSPGDEPRPLRVSPGKAQAMSPGDEPRPLRVSPGPGVEPRQ